MSEFGVIIARFQVPELHIGHSYLIREVLKRHDTVVILLGTTAGAPTDKNPLSFFVRKKMVLQHFPSVNVEALPDMPGDDFGWSDNVDTILANYPGKPVIYGSRGSFIPHYHGRHRIQELPAYFERSGTDIRNELLEPLHSTNFRAGIIHSVMSRYPIVYSTVDIACLKQEYLASGELRQELLLGRKPKEKLLRFPGGFVDTGDRTTLNAAKRELSEEVGLIETSDWEYIGTSKMDDPRYRGTKDSIMTTLYKCTYVYGSPKAADDISEVKWVNLKELTLEMVMPVHRELIELLRTRIHF